MFNGKVPYKDLFEQKGPLLYLIYGIGYIMSHDTFTGVFILECISFCTFLYYVFLISKLYLKDYYSLLVILLTSSIICTSTAFVQGGSAEEFCLPFFAYSSYSFIHIVMKNDWNKKHLFINGFIAGCISLIKFNLLGFWFIWMAMYFFRLVYVKKIFKAIKSCLYFLIGMLIPIALSILYFGVNNALKDYFDVYIVFNFSAYSTKIDIRTRIINMIYAIYNQMRVDKSIYFSLIIGFISIIIPKIYKNYWVNSFIFLSFIFLMIGVYIGGLPFVYYFLCFEFYIIFGFIFIFKIYDHFNVNRHIGYIMLIAICLCFSTYQIRKNHNISDIYYQKKDYSQFIFKEIINQSEDKTILNYDNLDGGFYTACDIVPNIKYFMRQNVDYNRYPQIIDGQNRYIQNKDVKFVIIREYYANIGYRNKIPYLSQNYNEIMSYTQIYEGMEFTYYLYELKVV